MQKLIEIMDEDEEMINDDQTIKEETQQPSDSDRFIERNAKDEHPK
jgi:hypothetical protein